MGSMMRTIVTVLVAFGACGCGSMVGPAAPPPPAPEPTAQSSSYLGQTAIQEEFRGETPSAVDVALEWARKYSEVSTQRDDLLNENHAFRQTQQQHAVELAELRHRAERAEQELSEANALLLEMRGELGQWKASVLGFRGEMLDAQKAQLGAMYKIMRLIGGEVPETAATPPATMPQAARADTGEEIDGDTR